MAQLWQFTDRDLAARSLVWSYSYTDSYTFETCDFYSPDSFEALRFSATEFIRDQLDLLYPEFSQCFNLAEFPDIMEQLKPSELAVFLHAAGAPEGTSFRSIDDHDCFSGLRAVIRHRLDQRSPGQLRLAAKLFNWTIDFGLSCCSDTNACAVIRVGSAGEVAPFLLERILSRIPNDSERCKPVCNSLSGTFEQRFGPLAPMLTILKQTVASPDWVQNQLALRLFFWIAEMYKVEIER